MFKRRNIIISLLLLFTFIPNVKAENQKVGNISVSGASIEVGETKQLTMNLSSDIKSADGIVESSDSTCVQIVSVSSTLGSGNKFAEIDFAGNGLTTAGTITIKGLRDCNANLIITANLGSSNGHDEERGTKFYSGNIIVKDSSVQSTPQTTTSTPSNTNVVTPTAKSEQNTVSSNTTSVKTNNNIAQTNSSATVNNQVAVNQVDLTLSSLVIDGYELNFNKNQLDYALEVENSVDKLNIKAVPTNSNYNVEISGNDNLLIGENIIKIIVSNNNEQKIYTIKVNKLQDPNKVYNNDNYLNDIIPSIGILSPKFDKDILNYVIYLPYEETKISFDSQPSAQTSNAEIDGPSELSVGDNKYTIKVRAESGDIREYTIIVKRANIFSDSSNNYLKNIILTNGKLNIDFDKNISTYYYTKNDGFKYDFELDDPNSTVNVYENDGTITIVVEASNGEKRVYTLIEKKNTVVKCILLVVLSILMGYLIKCLILEIKRNKKRKKKKQIEMK